MRTQNIHCGKYLMGKTMVCNGAICAMQEGWWENIHHFIPSFPPGPQSVSKGMVCRRREVWRALRSYATMAWQPWGPAMLWPIPLRLFPACVLFHKTTNPSETYLPHSKYSAYNHRLYLVYCEREKMGQKKHRQLQLIGERLQWMAAHCAGTLHPSLLNPPPSPTTTFICWF